MTLPVQPAGQIKGQIVQSAIAGCVKITVLDGWRCFDDRQGHLQADNDDRPCGARSIPAGMRH